MPAGRSPYRTPLTEGQILVWADAYRARTGRWPHAQSGPIPETPGATWNAVNMALYNGLRGLTGGGSLARLLRERRGKKRSRRPALDVGQILAWADAHRARTGRWPTGSSGPVAEAPGETWAAVEMALRQGHRGLPGGDGLARLLGRRRSKRVRASPGRRPARGPGSRPPG
jgi:hypothetical protein